MIFCDLKLFWHNILSKTNRYCIKKEHFLNNHKIQTSLTMIKNIILIVLGGVLLAALTLIGSCANDCNDFADTSTGIIQQDLIFGTCFTDIGALEQEYIIRDEAAFQALEILPVNSPECVGTTTLPEIDFNIHTLLGLYADGTCKASFDRHVIRDDAAMKYVYTISVTPCGNCESLAFGMNWVLVPKLPENYSVEFIVE